MKSRQERDCQGQYVCAFTFVSLKDRCLRKHLTRNMKSVVVAFIPNTPEAVTGGSL